MPTSPRSRLAVAVGAAPYALIAARALLHVRDNAPTFGDYALEQMATRTAEHLRLLLGAYSRFGWHHPGPMLFYVFAPFQWLAGGGFGGITLAAAVISLASAVGVLLIVRRVGEPAHVWAAAVVLVWFSFSFGAEQLADPWNPSVNVLPMALLLVAAAATVAGVRWLLPVVAGVGTFLVQAHIGTLPTVAAVCVVAAVAAVWRERRALRPWLAPVVLTVGVLGVLWAPTVYEQATHDPGNLHQLASFEEHDQTPPHPIGDVARIVTFELSPLLFDQGIELRGSGPDRPLPPTAAPDWIAAALLVVGLVVVIVLGRRRAPTEAWPSVLAAMGLIAIAATLYAGHRAAGDLYGYLLIYGSGLAIPVWLAIAAPVGSAVAQRWHRPVPIPVTAVALAALACAIAFTVLGATRIPTREMRLPWIDAGQAAVAAAGGHHTIDIHLLDDGAWPAASAATEALEEAGHRVRVDDNWLFMFGNDHDGFGTPGADLELSFASVPSNDPSLAAPVLSVPGVLVYATPAG